MVQIQFNIDSHIEKQLRVFMAYNDITSKQEAINAALSEYFLIRPPKTQNDTLREVNKQFMCSGNKFPIEGEVSKSIEKEIKQRKNNPEDYNSKDNNPEDNNSEESESENKKSE